MHDPFLVLGKNKLFFNEAMSAHTSFKIGGNADIVFLPENVHDIKTCINICKEHSKPYYVMGNGTNLLVLDKGYRGVVIKTTGLDNIKKVGDSFYVGAGVELLGLCEFFLSEGYTGLEFACGIPGTVGGAIFMNAGAYASEFSDVIVSVDLLVDGQISTFSKEQMNFGYRKSIVGGTDMVIVGATFSLQKGEYSAIKERMDELQKKRSEKQPLDMPSAGSTFKRPKGDFAGRLIRESGMVGYRIGGAVVSEKHAGFIINTGGATAQNVLDLIEKIKKAVKEKFNIDLEKELINIGE